MPEDHLRKAIEERYRLYRKIAREPTNMSEESLTSSITHNDGHVGHHDDHGNRARKFNPIPFFYNHPLTRTANPILNAQSGRRPISSGNPAVIGNWSFAVVTILLGTFNIFLPGKPNHVILPTAIMFGGLAQCVAGFIDLSFGGTFSGTILVSYGAFWTGAGMFMLPTVYPTLAAYEDERDLARANGIYNLFWSFYTLMLVGLSVKVKNGTFVLTWNLWWVFMTLLFTAVYNFTDILPLLRVSGVFAYLAALGAFYSGIAIVMEEQGVRLWVGAFRAYSAD
ncbi:GPR1/FUN34/yaaH family-domain-containing protein [Phycomyces nitens]|nr:GPR1/FUN34/yaaH family-domain-containing protein [Phycomyces nitens]